MRTHPVEDKQHPEGSCQSNSTINARKNSIPIS